MRTSVLVLVVVALAAPAARAEPNVCVNPYACVEASGEDSGGCGTQGHERNTLDGDWRLPLALGFVWVETYCYQNGPAGHNFVSTGAWTSTGGVVTGVAVRWDAVWTGQSEVCVTEASTVGNLVGDTRVTMGCLARPPDLPSAFG